MNTAICITLIIAITIVSLDLVAEIFKIIRHRQANNALVKIFKAIEAQGDKEKSAEKFETVMHEIIKETMDE